MSTFPRKILQNSRSDAWNTPRSAGLSPDAARAMRDLAARLGAELPKYLLAPEVAVLLSYFDDLSRRMYFDTLWNTGARPSEARALTPSDFLLETSRQQPQPVLRIKTLKQREQDASRGPGRPPAEVPPSPHPDPRYRKPPEPKTRLVPLLDASYARRMQEFLTTWRKRVKHQPVWPVASRQTPVNWLNEALDRAARDGVTFSVPVTPHTFRHSFAMHLVMCGVPDKTLQALMGHRYGRSTEVYTRVFTLDALAGQGLSFSADLETSMLMIK